MKLSYGCLTRNGAVNLARVLRDKYGCRIISKEPYEDGKGYWRFDFEEAEVKECKLPVDRKPRRSNSKVPRGGKRGAAKKISRSKRSVKGH